MTPIHPMHSINVSLLERKTVADGATEVVFDAGEQPVRLFSGSIYPCYASRHFFS